MIANRRTLLPLLLPAVQQAREAGESLKKDLQKEIERRAVERACEMLHDVLPGELRQTAHHQPGKTRDVGCGHRSAGVKSIVASRQ